MIRFCDYIEYSSLDESNSAINQLTVLRRQPEFDMVGFKEIQILEASYLISSNNQTILFRTLFAPQEDRIFIISPSLGNWSSGIPLLLKNIRHANHDLSTWRTFYKKPLLVQSPCYPILEFLQMRRAPIDKATFILQN